MLQFQDRPLTNGGSTCWFCNFKLASGQGHLANRLMETILTIGEVSRRSGLAASALRFYETRGLIESERRGRGQRRFPRHVLRRLAFIVFAQRIGLTLNEIGEELSRLPTRRTPTAEDWARLSVKWLTRIDERISEMKRLREGLTTCIGCGCLSLRTCHFTNPDDRVASRGPGPHFWARPGAT